MLRQKLTGKVAVVSGAASGIGKATALLLAEDGADVAVVDVQGPAAEETAAAIEQMGVRAAAFTADVRREEAVTRALEGVRQALGTPSIVVSNAGVGGNLARFHEETTANLMDQVAVHLQGMFFFWRQTIEAMRAAGWGRLVGTSSLAATVGLPGSGAYGAAKAAMIGLMRTVALENATSGVTANCVLPGVIDTPILAPVPAERRAKMLRNNPARRFGRAEDIAAAIAYVCSLEAGYLTGQCISPNGGLWFS